MYELALHAARQAERAFNFERGYTNRTFLPCESVGQPARRTAGRRAAAAGAAHDGEGVPRRQRARVRADQAHLAAAALPAAVPPAEDDRRVRDRDAGVDVRPRLSGAVHAPHQERDADDPRA